MADTKQTAHTPTPWKVCPEQTYIFDAAGKMIAEIRGAGHLTRKQQGENISDIVRCVNSHELLVEALKAITSIPNATTGGDWDEIERARNIAEAALKQAGGE